ncbi:MAG: Transcription initiation protein spt3 [Candelina mexicana]|nr:MAG: Transcription initiation protein spt3 [Candelina mexicana]
MTFNLGSLWEYSGFLFLCINSAIFFGLGGFTRLRISTIWDSSFEKIDGSFSLKTRTELRECSWSSEMDDFETFDQWKERLIESIAQMMFVSGETVEASPETTGMIEEIVRQQVIEMLTQCTAQAYRRGVRSISTDDLIFLIRHDKAKVSRLRTFLSWKDVRKNVKDSDDKGGGDAADFAAGDDPIGVGVVGTGGPATDGAKKNKKAKVGLPWEVASFYSETVPEREDEEDEDEEEMNYATLQRLKNADERTKDMTKEEYVHFSECRQASFTFRKGKRFKEWAGFGIVTDSKPNDDIVDILGFLTFEIVQTLTEEALKIKEAEDLEKKEKGDEKQNRKRKRERGLFDGPEEGRTPVEPKHIEEAFRKLQHRGNKGRAMRNFGRALHRTPLKLVRCPMSLELLYVNICLRSETFDIALTSNVRMPGGPTFPLVNT